MAIEYSRKRKYNVCLNKFIYFTPYPLLLPLAWVEFLDRHVRENRHLVDCLEHLLLQHMDQGLVLSLPCHRCPVTCVAPVIVLLYTPQVCSPHYADRHQKSAIDGRRYEPMQFPCVRVRDILANSAIAALNNFLCCEPFEYVFL